LFDQILHGIISVKCKVKHQYLKWQIERFFAKKHNSNRLAG